MAALLLAVLVSALAAAPALAATGKPAKTGTTSGKPAKTGTTSGKSSASTGKRAGAKPQKAKPGWAAPATIGPVVSADLIPPQPAVSAVGQLAVGAGTTSEDRPASARAQFSTVADGALGASRTPEFTSPRALTGSQQVLAAAYLGTRLVLLTGTSPAGNSLACCSSFASATVTGSTVRRGRTLSSGLAGATIGQLVGLGNALLAVVDNQSGVWVARAGANGSFGGSRQLVAGGAQPPVTAATELAGGGSMVAWTTPAGGLASAPAPQEIWIASGTAGELPGDARLALTVPTGVTVEQLALASHRTGATLAYVGSWYDARGGFHSQVFVSDLGARASTPVALSPAKLQATTVSLASGDGVHQVIAWQACEQSTGTCTAQAALRPHGAGWGAVRGLGAVDPTDFPVAAQSLTGQSLVAWIAGGDVKASAAAAGKGAFGAVHTVSAHRDDANLALSFGPGRYALASWTQGTGTQQLAAARFTS